MMERGFIEQKIKELQIEQHIRDKLGKVGFSSAYVKKTPLGDKIIITANRPGVIVGSKGSTIKQLTKELGKKFKLDNPQIEIADVPQLNHDVNLVAERIAVSLERFGTSKFKGVAHSTLKNVLDAGALGVEILISGKIPGARARRWRFYKGYLKKCGDVAVNGVQRAYSTALLKQGLVGVQVRIMPSDIKLPDDITVNKELLTEESVEDIKDITEEKIEEKQDEKEKTKPKKRKAVKKRTTSKNKGKKESKDMTVEKKSEIDGAPVDSASTGDDDSTVKSSIRPDIKEESDIKETEVVSAESSNKEGSKEESMRSSEEEDREKEPDTEIKEKLTEEKSNKIPDDKKSITRSSEEEDKE